jgi:hypothetical protein
VKKSKQKENNKCTLYGVVISAFRPDIENWGLGTYIYVMWRLNLKTFVGEYGNIGKCGFDSHTLH